MVRYLQSSGVRSLMVTNRTFERAVELAEEFHGNPIRYEDFPRYLQMADVVIGSSGSPQILLQSETVRDALKERRQKAMFLIDLGVPRNFDPRIDEIDNVYLYNIDNLKEVAAVFLRWLSSLEQVPTIVALRQKLEEIRRGELEKSLSTSLKGLSEKQREALEDMTAAMISKILHVPITHLKKRPGDQDEELYIEALKKLFDLGEK
ncbi:MAG: hypothetical protein HYV00_01450 [Deltaproteobacteria bacterium]|nr:hypothetical protein [Deltaproteobacteria bacterium]